MRHQETRRDSKTFFVVDEDCGIPASVVENYWPHNEEGPLAQSDPRSALLSMSESDKTQHYDVYEYSPATRPEQGQGFPTYAGNPVYAGDYVPPPAQVPSGLPHAAATFTPLATTQTYAAHDTAYYNAQPVSYPAYLEAAPRPLPEITSFSPNQGRPGTRVTIYLQSLYDFDSPQVTPVIMFGSKRCASIMTKTTQQGQPYQYALSVDAPPLTPTASPSPQVTLALTFDDSSVSWSPPSTEFGQFTYLLDDPPLFPVLSPPAQPKKRKLSPEASPRRSPTKKQSLHNLAATANAATPQFRQPSLPEQYAQSRRFSVPDLPQGYGSLTKAQTQPYYPTQTTPSLQTSNSPQWSYPQHSHSTTRSPSGGAVAVHRTPIQPSTTNVSNPPLIRTSTLQQSPTTPGTQPFNPYAMYPANTKAVLKIEGDLNSMADKWTPAEREAGRRLVQFRRSQAGSVITATFEPVTLEDRIPNSICVSCIMWEERNECYVTSVDTISLLESLVAVRFTVEEKNRIRRNLEGFRPATVSKTKPESEEFFKLIMGFPNPKPRNIEKDVKVFPWRILGGALKKIISKYSASYSSTAGALHTPVSGAGPTYPSSRPSEVGLEAPAARPMASPRSTSSSATSHGNAYAANMATSAYATAAMGPTGLGIGPPAGHPADLRLSVPPVTAALQTTSWHQPQTHYSGDLSVTRGAWDFAAPYPTASPATGLPSSAQSYQSFQPFPNRMPSLTAATPGMADGRWIPLQQQYEDRSHQTTTG